MFCTFFICWRWLSQSLPPAPPPAFGLAFSFVAASCATALVSALICAAIALNRFAVALVLAALADTLVILVMYSWIFVAVVRQLVSRLVLVASGGSSSGNLLIGVGCFDQRLKVIFGAVVVGFGGVGLLLPLQHVVLVEVVAVIQLLEIKLELVLIRDRDIRADEGSLVVINALAKSDKVFVVVPFCVVRVFQCFLCLDVKRALTVVEVL
jgi:hypothetical protein